MSVFLFFMPFCLPYCPAPLPLAFPCWSHLFNTLLHRTPPISAAPPPTPAALAQPALPDPASIQVLKDQLDLSSQDAGLGKHAGQPIMKLQWWQSADASIVV